MQVFENVHIYLQVSVKDLRSQVVREACITVAYMSQLFSHKADRFVENLLQSIVNLIPNSAKVSKQSPSPVCYFSRIIHAI